MGVYRDRVEIPGLRNQVTDVEQLVPGVRVKRYDISTGRFYSRMEVVKGPLYSAGLKSDPMMTFQLFACADNLFEDRVTFLLSDLGLLPGSDGKFTNALVLVDD